MDTRASHATIRFGLRGSEPLPADPVAWLRGQLNGVDHGVPRPSLADGFEALRQDRDNKPPPGTPRQAGQMFKSEIDALVGQALATASPFRERLVWFWANHFTISRRNGRVAAVAGDYIRSANARTSPAGSPTC